MNQDVLKSIADSLMQSKKNEDAGLYEKNKESFENEFGINLKRIAKQEDFESLNYLFISEISSFLDGFVRTEIVDNDQYCIIFKNARLIERQFRYWIEIAEGSVCCADKSRTIVRALLDHFKTGKEINWNYENEFAYHLPCKIFTTHQEIISFYYAFLKFYSSGEPLEYFRVSEGLLKKTNKILENDPY